MYFPPSWSSDYSSVFEDAYFSRRSDNKQIPTKTNSLGLLGESFQSNSSVLDLTLSYAMEV